MKNPVLWLFIIIFFTLPVQLLLANNPPNILFIAVDDLRPDLGFNGNHIIKTPNIDKLASEGRAFLNHYVQVPTCGASRHSLLTGIRPNKPIHLNNHAMYEELSQQAEKEFPETFVHHFKRRQYYTVGIGKISHSTDGYVYGYEEEKSDVKELPHSWDELLFDAGKWGTGWNAFFGYADGSNRQGMKKQVKPYEAADVEDDGYPDGLTTRLAIDKLKDLSQKNQPFLLAVGYFKPHLPFTAPQKYWDLYNRDQLPLAHIKDLPQNVHMASLHNSSEFNSYEQGDEKAGAGIVFSDAYARKLIHAYYACVSYIDAQIGQLIKALEENGLADNTVIVLWSDHGWHLGDHTIWGKHTLFEKALKSPLIVYYPGMNAPGKATSALVETVDIYPTLLDICGIPAPGKLDGKSLYPVLQNPDKQVQKAAYSYFRNGISMRTDRYRLTRYYKEDEARTELYDHLTDPHETINIADENQKLVKKLSKLLDKGNTGLYD
jgi:arylsulfatase A-like enzyme